MSSYYKCAAYSTAELLI